MNLKTIKHFCQYISVSWNGGLRSGSVFSHFVTHRRDRLTGIMNNDNERFLFVTKHLFVVSIALNRKKRENTLFRYDMVNYTINGTLKAKNIENGRQIKNDRKC